MTDKVVLNHYFKMYWTFCLRHKLWKRGVNIETNQETIYGCNTNSYEWKGITDVQ